jgi:DNA-binding XRE family transcriptional regulator
MRRSPASTPASAPATPRAARRSTAARRRAKLRTEYIARRIGVALREARIAQGLHQSDVAVAAGIAQPYYSRIERGLELGVSLVTLASCAAALNVQLAAFIEALPGATLPRDMEHLVRQNLVVVEATPGGWTSGPEALIRGDGPRPRSIDVLLVRPARREAAVTEIWDLVDDGGAVMRGLDAKVEATRERLGPAWHGEGLLLVRATHRNRALISQLKALFDAKYPAPSSGWLKALRDPATPMPTSAGFAWTGVKGDRLVAARLR